MFLFFLCHAFILSSHLFLSLYKWVLPEWCCKRKNFFTIDYNLLRLSKIVLNLMISQKKKKAKEIKPSQFSPFRSFKYGRYKYRRTDIKKQIWKNYNPAAIKISFSWYPYHHRQHQSLFDTIQNPIYTSNLLRYRARIFRTPITTP